MDGVGRTYERLRGRRFGDLARKLDLIASICPFAINVVVNKDTVDELDRVAAFAHESGARELLLLPQQPTAGVPGIDVESARRLREWISREPRSLPLAISEAGASSEMPLADPYGDEPALDAHAHVDATACLRANAYSSVGIPIQGSIIAALGDLRRTEDAS
jgi:hypothetical protein